MQFLWPFMLWSLLLIPVLVIAYILAQRRRRRYTLRYANLSLVKEALGRGPGKRRHIPPIVFLIALGVMLLATARPYTVTILPAQEGTIILVMDVSGSMQADDLKPSRIDAAKTAARDFIQRQPDGIQVGVVSFSDNAFLIQPPTDDRQAVMAAINRLEPLRGTAIGSGILAGLEAIFEKPNSDAPITGGITNPILPPVGTPVPKGTYTSALIVLLTDGENNEGPLPLDAGQEAAVRGVRIYTVGIGSAQGTILHIQGRAIRTRLDEATLRQLADETGGKYYNASSAQDLTAIYENLDTHFVMKSERTEITAVFTSVAVILSLIAGALSLLWFNHLP